MNLKKFNGLAPTTQFFRDKVVTGRTFYIVAFIAILAASAALFFFARSRLDLNSLLIYGYSGVIVINLVCAATIFFPIPGEAINIAAGATLYPLWIGVIASMGATVGELTSYYAGHLGKRIIPDRYANRYEKAESWLKRYGNFAVFIFALLPILVFDLLGIAAGTFKFPLWKFILFCWLGRLIRCLLEAYLGYGAFGFLPQLW